MKHDGKEYNVGDLLRLTNTGAIGCAAKPGATAIVTGFSIYGSTVTYVKVKWVRNNLDKGQSDGGYLFRDFEKVATSLREIMEESL